MIINIDCSKIHIEDYKITLKSDIPFNYTNIHNYHSRLGKVNGRFHFGLDKFMNHFQPYLIHENYLEGNHIKCMDNCSSIETFLSETKRLKVYNFNDLEDIKDIPINICTLDLFDKHNYLIKDFNKDNWNRIKMLYELRK